MRELLDDLDENANPSRISVTWEPIDNWHEVTGAGTNAKTNTSSKKKSGGGFTIFTMKDEAGQYFVKILGSQMKMKEVVVAEAGEATPTDGEVIIALKKRFDVKLKVRM